MQTISPDRFEDSRNDACRRLNLITIAFLPINTAIAFLLGPAALVTPIISAAFVALSFATRGSRPATRRMGSGIALMGQAVAFTAACGGSPWQIDAHMSFYAALAMLGAMVDLPVIFAAVGLIVVHHLSFGLLWPWLVYPSTAIFENIQRTLLHGSIVLVEAVVLMQTVRERIALNVEAVAREAELSATSKAARAAAEVAEAAREAAEAHGRRAEAMRQAAERAMAEAGAEHQRFEATQLALREAESRESQALAQRAEQSRQAVESLRRALARLSQSDLTVRIAEPFAEDYEPLRTDFNNAVSRLGSAIELVLDVSGSLHAQAGSIAEATNQLAQRTEQQAARLEEATATITGIATTVRKAADRSAAAETASARAMKEAGESGEVVNSAVAAINAIADSSQKIERITDVIDDIAFQTNLLALNAGVEAARAGEAGRGFAVVASEVRALAQRCSDAAREISGLIQKSSAQVERGVKLVGQTGVALVGISGAVADVAAQVAEISLCVKEQAGALTGVTATIAQIDRVTQSNAAAFEETTAACKVMSEGSEEMLDKLGQFATAASGPVGTGRRTQPQAA